MSTQPNQTIALPPYVTIENFNPQFVGLEDVVEKPVPGSNGAQKYKEAAAFYMYGGARRSEFLLELPPCTVKYGISEQQAMPQQGQQGQAPGPQQYQQQQFQGMAPGQPQAQKKKDEFTMNITFGSDDFGTRSVAVIDGLHDALVNKVFEKKAGFGMFQTSLNTIKETMKNPAYRPFDKTTGQLIQGKPTTMYVKLLYKKMGQGRVQKTLFTDLNGVPLETHPNPKARVAWHQMMGMEMKIIPMIHVKGIYHSTKPSIQMTMISAIVIDIRPPNTQSYQIQTAQRYLADNPDAQKTLEERISMLSMMTPGPEQHPESTASDLDASAKPGSQQPGSQQQYQQGGPQQQQQYGAQLPVAPGAGQSQSQYQQQAFNIPGAVPMTPQQFQQPAGPSNAVNIPQYAPQPTPGQIPYVGAQPTPSRGGIPVMGGDPQMQSISGAPLQYSNAAAFMQQQQTFARPAVMGQ